MCYVPEGSSQDGLITVPTEGEESGGDDWLSTTRGLLDANFFVAAVDVEESDISTYYYNSIKRVCACMRACVRVCACAGARV